MLNAEKDYILRKFIQHLHVMSFFIFLFFLDRRVLAGLFK